MNNRREERNDSAVGGQGQDRMGNHPYGNCAFVPGGWNGGGANRSAGNGTPGGGASDIRVGGNALANRIIVAGGGGGCGWSYLNSFGCLGSD